MFIKDITEMTADESGGMDMERGEGRGCNDIDLCFTRRICNLDDNLPRKERGRRGLETHFSNNVFYKPFLK